MTDRQFFLNYFDSGENGTILQILQRLCTEPSAAPEPILLIGQSGLGKTHLLRAIQRGIDNALPQRKVLYQMGTDFVDGMIQQIYNEHRPETLPCYQGIDTLLVDDLSHIRGKASTQQEVLMLFDFLRKRNTHVLCTSLSGTVKMEYFTSHFPGIILELAPLSGNSARRMIAHKAAQCNLTLTDRQIKRIMSKAAGNGSLIEGAVKRYRFQIAAGCQLIWKGL